jgi:hypothetical protein
VGRTDTIPAKGAPPVILWRVTPTDELFYGHQIEEEAS